MRGRVVLGSAGVAGRVPVVDYEMLHYRSRMQLLYAGATVRWFRHSLTALA